jgi:hypothetical protein
MMKWMITTMRMSKPMTIRDYESMRKSDIDIKMKVRDKVGTKWRRNTRYARNA